MVQQGLLRRYANQKRKRSNTHGSRQVAPRNFVRNIEPFTGVMKAEMAAEPAFS